MNNRLAENVKLIRKQKWKLSQDRFATLLDSSRSKINSYENSGVEPSISFMVKLENLTGIAVSAIYSKPIPIDSIPLEPIITHGEGVNSFPNLDEMVGNSEKYTNFEDMVMSRFSLIELRLSRIEADLRRKNRIEENG